MNAEIATTETNVIVAIRSCLQRGISELKKAGQLYVEAITKNPEMKQIIQDSIPEISPSTWVKFEMLGRGDTIAQLVYDDSAPARRLLKCPLSEQIKYSSEPIEFLLPKGDVLKIDLHHLSKGQIEQVFAKDHVRNLSEQRAWLESMKSTVNISMNDEKPYEIIKHTVKFKKNVELDRKEIAEILAKLV